MPLILPVLALKRTPSGGTRLTIATAQSYRPPIIPVFTSEQAFLDSRPAGSEGLKVTIEQVLKILDSNDVVVLDPGSAHATVWPWSDLVALLMLLYSDSPRSE